MTGDAERRAQRRWGTVPPAAAIDQRTGGRVPVTTSAAAVDRGKLMAAARRQQLDRERSATPIPARITIALGDLSGPEVDIACGVVEPAVDQWEAGELVPTVEQVRLLAELTGYPEAFFYLPIDTEQMRVLMCGPDGLTVVTSWVDERGVLHREYEEHPKRKPGRRAKQGATPMPGQAVMPGLPEPAAAPAAAAPAVADPARPHRFVRDPRTGVCTVCELPRSNRRHRNGS